MMRQVYTGSIMVAGYEVPLPPGGYVVLSNIRSDDLKLPGSQAFLGRIHDRQLTGAVLISAIHDGPGDGFSPPDGWPEGNQNLLFERFEAVTPNDHQAYWFVDNAFTPPWQCWADRSVKMTQAERTAMSLLETEGVTYPQDLVSVRFTRAEKTSLLEVKSFFSPDSEGLSSRPAISYRDSDWHVGNVNRSPEKMAYVERLKVWGDEFWPRVKDAFAAAELARQTRGAPTPSHTVH